MYKILTEQFWRFQWKAALLDGCYHALLENGFCLDILPETSNTIIDLKNHRPNVLKSVVEPSLLDTYYYAALALLPHRPSETSFMVTYPAMFNQVLQIVIRVREKGGHSLRSHSYVTIGEKAMMRATLFMILSDTLLANSDW